MRTVAQAPLLSLVHGAIVRADSTKKELALVFTADEFGEGLPAIRATLKKQRVPAGFFFTGRFYRNPLFQREIRKLQAAGHYLGPHSDAHLLYCDWNRRDSLLVTRDSFARDLANNIASINALGLPSPHLFIPPFEWWNDSIAAWAGAAGFTLFNFTPGLRTQADYTWPELGASYKSSVWILNWLRDYTAQKPTALNGSILLVHAGTDPRRADKLYARLNELLVIVKKKGYRFVRIDRLLASVK